MNEEQWDAATKPHEMLDALQGHGIASERKLRLFTTACCRRAWDMHRDDRVGSAVELAERYADDPALAGQFARLGDPASRRGGGVYVPYLGRENPFDEAAGVSLWITNLVCGRSKPQGSTAPALLAERATHVHLLRDIFGNPYRPLQPLSPSLLAWSDGLIIKLAEAAYAERELPSGHLENARLAVLADALTDAGSTDDRLLEHLRSPGPHVRGCVGVDAVLGRQ
jgi:hypothetical protein